MSAPLNAATAEFIAGAVGGSAGVIFGHPLDTVRVRMQQPGAGRLGSMSAVWMGMVKAEGARSLFQGMSSPLATAAFQNAVSFQSYGAQMSFCGTAVPPQGVAARLLQPDMRDGVSLTWTNSFLAGCIAGFINSAIVCPVDLIKVQLQVAHKGAGAPKGPVALAASILRREGILGMFRGFWATVVRDSPSTGLYYLAYQAAREVADPGTRLGSGGSDWKTTLVAGGVAGVVSWASIYPLDVVKNRLQAAPNRYRGIVHCFRVSVQEEGYGCLVRGLKACLLRAFLVNAAIFCGYESATEAMMRWGMLERQPGVDAAGLSHHPEQLHKT